MATASSIDIPKDVQERFLAKILASKSAPRKSAPLPKSQQSKLHLCKMPECPQFAVLPRKYCSDVCYDSGQKVMRKAATKRRKANKEQQNIPNTPQEDFEDTVAPSALDTVSKAYPTTLEEVLALVVLGKGLVTAVDGAPCFMPALDDNGKFMMDVLCNGTLEKKYNKHGTDPRAFFGCSNWNRKNRVPQRQHELYNCGGTTTSRGYVSRRPANLLKEIYNDATGGASPDQEMVKEPVQDNSRIWHAIHEMERIIRNIDGKVTTVIKAVDNTDAREEETRKTVVEIHHCMRKLLESLG